jgi:hypothetical protein
MYKSEIEKYIYVSSQQKIFHQVKISYLPFCIIAARDVCIFYMTQIIPQSI